MRAAGYAIWPATHPLETVEVLRIDPGGVLTCAKEGTKPCLQVTVTGRVLDVPPYAVSDRADTFITYKGN